MVFGTPTKGRRFGGFREYQTVKINVKVAVCQCLGRRVLFISVLCYYQLREWKQLMLFLGKKKKENTMQFTLIMKKQFN